MRFRLVAKLITTLDDFETSMHFVSKHVRHGLVNLLFIYF